MAAVSDSLLRLRSSMHTFNLLAFAGVASLGTFALLTSISIGAALESDKPKTIASPRETAVSQTPPEQLGRLPYPPDALPGARDIDSPYGSVRINEWGPKGGQKVMLIHGISTPSIALADLAHRLVDKGCRVMLFDLFGRGYSAAPDPALHHYGSALYSSQIFLCLQSSPIPWTSFILIGYSLGGAIAADFTSYFPNLISGLILVASGGLIRTKHITWKSRLLYSTSGLIPEWLIERLVAKRLWTGPETARTIEPEPDTATSSLNGNAAKGGLRSQAVYVSSNTGLLAGNPFSTVSNVVDWQIVHHKGFVPAFISSIRYAPIHDQHNRWEIVRQNIEKGVGRLQEVWLVLGETDPIIIADELVQDASEALGKDNLRIKIVDGAGHEVAINRAAEIADVVGQLL